MAGRAFNTLLMDREQAKQNVESALTEMARLARSSRIASETFEREHSDLMDIEAAMRQIDPEMMKILEEAGE